MSKRGSFFLRFDGSHLLVSFAGSHLLVPVADSICFALGNKSGSFCEAVNCERSEQEGKFLFAMLVSILWFPPPSKASWYNARESAESGGTIHLEINFTPEVY